jgi:acetolactate synthase-1/2/3 large subunit
MDSIKKKIKVSDYIIRELIENGVTTVYGVTGGAVVHLFDSIDRAPNISSVFMNNEQAASYAVEAHAKASSTLSAGIFTTGPGATNAISGLAAAWLDSLPCVFISGQVRSNQAIRGRKLRQVGTQEVEIVPVVTPLTKYAVTIFDLESVKYELQKAIYLANSGRKGPVWLDIPVDIQWAYIEESKFKEFVPDLIGFSTAATSQDKIDHIIDLLKQATRPLVLVGYGVRLSKSESLLQKLIETYNIPCVSSWNMADWLSSEHHLNVGRPGVSGQRGANLAIQNCDLLLVIGSHLNSSIVGTRPDWFARDARIVVVDVDRNELENCVVSCTHTIHADAFDFISKLFKKLERIELDIHRFYAWNERIKNYQSKNKIALDYADNKDKINSYFFSNRLSALAGNNDLFVIDGGGTIVYSSFQSIEIKSEQRLILSTGLCAMGSGFPEAIGVAHALPGRTIHCLVGDGSLPFNMQELSVIVGKKLSVKIYVFNNEGYVSIRDTQRGFLDGNFVGSSPDSGLYLPKPEAVASAFSIPYHKISNQSDIDDVVSLVINTPGPVLCEILVSSLQEIVPRQAFNSIGDGLFEPRPLEDMYPILDRDEFLKLMIIPEINTEKILIKAREINLVQKYPRILWKDNILQDKGNPLDSIEKNYKFNNNEIIDKSFKSDDNCYGANYFDGSRKEGDGTYTYDKKYWRSVAEDLVAEYGLVSGSRVLEIGCSKGFLIHELLQLVPGILIRGIDISNYAVENAMQSVKEKIELGDVVNLSFADNEFDLVLAINTISELELDDCKKALIEIMRVTKKNSFITLNSWRNRREREALMNWVVSSKSNYSTDEWKMILKEIDYQGDYFWFLFN